ncbi:MAG: hypothetical protein UV79_C0009G0021 [candidate division TM6 bacterium GW2011_GWF2_43_17]|nr:MAG: hypothetical protein UV79_C0009G0021 [candidate division TM6 bacterium GW2011_GWF2_43_17]HAU30380.1 hypothetical protein [Candidatus Dependentiae bacterium]
MDQNNIFEAAQAVISVELLTTLEWLITHEEVLLKELLQTALEDGLREKINKLQEDGSTNPTYMLENMTIFFERIEELLADLLTQEPRNEQRKTAPKLLSKAIGSIDQSTYDAKTINVSVEKTSRALKKNKSLNAKKLFFREFLKNWNPTKKNPVQ